VSSQCKQLGLKSSRNNCLSTYSSDCVLCLMACCLFHSSWHTASTLRRGLGAAYPFPAQGLTHEQGTLSPRDHRTCEPSTSRGLLVCQPLSAALLVGSSGHQGSKATPHLNSVCTALQGIAGNCRSIQREWSGQTIGLESTLGPAVKGTHTRKAAVTPMRQQASDADKESHTAAYIQPKAPT
jgi:hypothetical protein